MLDFIPTLVYTLNMKDKIVCPHCNAEFEINAASILRKRKPLSKEHQIAAIRKRWSTRKLKTVDNPSNKI